MRRTLLAFLGLFFVGYWLWIAPVPRDQQASFEPVLPGLVRILPNSAKQRLFPSQSENRTADLTGIRRWLGEEAIKVGGVDRNPSAHVLRLKQKALTLTPGELAILKDVSLSPSASGDERFLSVYIIGLAESAQARDFLKQIAQTPIPRGTSANDRAYSDEVVIRANALESVVKRLSSDESKQYLNDLLAKTQDPSLARHARYWLTRL